MQQDDIGIRFSLLVEKALEEPTKDTFRQLCTCISRDVVAKVTEPEELDEYLEEIWQTQCVVRA